MGRNRISEDIVSGKKCICSPGAANDLWAITGSDIRTVESTCHSWRLPRLHISRHSLNYSIDEISCCEPDSRTGF